MQTSAWRVEAATVTGVRSSSFFEDRATFPAGSAEPDCALLMRDVPVVWQPAESLGDVRTSAKRDRGGVPVGRDEGTPR